MKLPSLQFETDFVWSGDPALDSPTRLDGESDEAWSARSKEWSDRLVRARQTGQWDGLMKPGGKVTRFSVGYVPRKAWARFEDKVRTDEIGIAEAMVLAFQMAVRSVAELEGFDGKAFKVSLRHDEEFGQIATDDILNLLDAYYRVRKEQVPDVADPVLEMGAAVIARQRGVDPLSHSA